ncbi:MAG TPA: molybdopterin-binding protein, partial [Nitrososphaerales archaeon]|nr:molybdopterin-binding protein [Nitrososphaerales archaeon]
MARVEMLAVGKELLIGRTMNSNALWIGKRLARMGSMIKEIMTVDDDLDEIGRGLKEALRRDPDFLIVVGGLGPTPDDMTLSGVSRALGMSLRRNREALSLIREHYAKRGLTSFELTPARVKMARLPGGSIPLRNDSGTAPGVRLVAGKTTVFCLPGVPSEMRSIFRASVEPEVKAKLGSVHRCYVRMKLTGVFESALAPVLSKELRRHPGAYIKSHPRGIREGVSRIELDVAVVGADRRQAFAEGEAIAQEMARSVAGLGGRVES